MVLLLATKSMMIVGGTLWLLSLLRGRSASDRSVIAHLGLAALVALPLGSLLLPSLEVTTSYAPVFAEAGEASPVASQVVQAMTETASPPRDPGRAASAQAVNWLLVAYAVPALFLIGSTVLALLRLALLETRAQVVVDRHWLGVLARAQRRIGFGKATALLTSDEIASPASWGLMRPVILLDTGALAARGEAEAVIVHELAHVVRWDWAKLVLSRVIVAMFWFNPFVWLLAQEAHQLREEAADDAVLAAQVDDTDYAALLVSTARHQRSGLLPGAHGVAPARKSLARRVRRVLERGLNRSAGSRRWTGAMALVATALVVPLASLQFTDAAIAAPLSRLFERADSRRESPLPAPPGGPVLRPAAALAREVAASAQPAPLAEPAAEQDHVIRTVAVAGVQRLEPETIIGYVQLRPGQVFTPAAGEQALRDLAATELFANFHISIVNGGVVITVVENPAINRIVLRGNSPLKEDEILREIGLAPGQVLNRSKVGFDRARIALLYERRGWSEPTVEPQLVQLDQNRVDVVFAIDEGGPILVSEIDIVGNEAFPDRQLRGLMLNEVGSNLKGSIGDSLAMDQQYLRAFYLGNGYADVRMVAAQAVLAADRRSISIRYTVEEGQQHLRGR